MGSPVPVPGYNDELQIRSYEFFEVRVGASDGECVRRGNEKVCRDWINRELASGGIKENKNPVYLFRLQLVEAIKLAPEPQQ